MIPHLSLSKHGLEHCWIQQCQICTEKSILHHHCRCNHHHHHHHPVHPTWQHTSVSPIEELSTWQHRGVLLTSWSINYSGQTVMTNPSSSLSWQCFLMLSGQQQTGTLCRHELFISSNYNSTLWPCMLITCICRSDRKRKADQWIHVKRRKCVIGSRKQCIVGTNEV